MNIDDTLIDATIWSCIELSSNPDDFKSYLEHRPTNAAHLEEAEKRVEELQCVAQHGVSRFPQAVAQVEALANSGNSSAQFHMGKFHHNGRGVPEDSSLAARWYEMAAALGEIRAAHNLAGLKLEGDGVEKDIEGAVALCKIAMDSGDPEGAEMLGYYFLNKENLDIERALSFFRKAYELGSLDAGRLLARVLYNEAPSQLQRSEAIAILLALIEQKYLPAIRALASIYTEGNRSDRNFGAARSLHLKLLDAGENESMLSLGWLDLNTPPASDSKDKVDPLVWFKKAWDAELFDAAGYIGRAYLYGEGAEKSLDNALHWFKLGAEKGEAGCSYYVGLIHEKGIDGDGDDKAAEPWYRKAAEAGLGDAQLALARLLVRNTGFPVDGTEALKWLNVAINDGNTEAMLLLAHLYENGIGVIKNQKAAFDLCLCAADAGDLTGQSETGWRLIRGIGCDVNTIEGLRWHKKAAESGRAYDQGILGYSYLYGQLSLERDYDEAIKWARLSATQGEALGQYVVGECYHYGCGVPKSRTDSIEWLKKSAEQGYVRAQAHLADIYYIGEEGKNKNLLEAGRWASQAADAGHQVAQLILGRMFLFGEQVEADSKAALEWFRLAANQDDPESMYWVGRLTAEGVGTKRDWMIALTWLKKAADAGMESAVELLKSFGVDYVPGSQNRHRLSPDEPIAIDADFDVKLLEGRWACAIDEMKMDYIIRADGTFSSTVDVGAEEPMTSEGRWAIRGTKFIWDVWESNIPLEDSETMDDQIVFVSAEELHLTESDGRTLKFQKVTCLKNTEHQVFQFSNIKALHKS